MQPKDEIRKFIIEYFYYGHDDGSLGDDTSFLEQSIMDSTGVLEMVSFIEETYGIPVDDEELIPDNLDSINKIANFVLKKKDGK